MGLFEWGCLLAAPFFVGSLIVLTGAEWVASSYLNVKRVALLCVLYPICEEIIFRGVVQGALIRNAILKKQMRWLPSWANLATSVLFAVVHALVWSDYTGLLVFFPSLIFGEVYDRHKKLVICAVFHGWFNWCALGLVEFW